MIIENITWTEKYRPKNFNNIILNNTAKYFFDNMLQKNIFPNLLLYGPPGTGKTTTIINLINKYQELYSKRSNSLIIHLNASDDRGIDIIRHNIYNFVKSNNLFDDGIKFVILDEVDYMTRIAQIALKCLIQEHNENIRYCLICNYISKIDYSLQFEFVKIRFHKLPKNSIYSFIKNIINKEKINISHSNLINIIDYYETDVRSMINYIQSNSLLKKNILNDKLLNNIFKIHTEKNNEDFNKYINNLINTNNINLSTILKKYIQFLIKNKFKFIIEKNKNILNLYELIIHNIDIINNSNKYIYISILYNSLYN